MKRGKFHSKIERRSSPIHRLSLKGGVSSDLIKNLGTQEKNMDNFIESAFVATSSRLLLSRGFDTRVEAEAQATEWEALAPVNTPNDCEAPATVYTAAEWATMFAASQV